MSNENMNFNQQPYQPGMPVPPKQKKPFFKRTWVIVTGAVLLVFIIIGIASGGGDSTDTAATPSGGETSAGQPAPSEKPKATTKPAEKTQAPAAKKWVKLVTLSGKADKESDTIKTHGGKIRISYTFTDSTNSGIIVAGIYFLKEGTDLQKDGGIPEVMVSEPGKDTTTIRKDAGEYFIKVTAANVKYTVVVEEEQ